MPCLAGFFRLSIPELLYCHYQGDEVHDVLVIENLVETGGRKMEGERSDFNLKYLVGKDIYKT